MSMTINTRRLGAALLVLCLLLAGSQQTAGAKDKKKKSKDEDPYTEYVWPPPPDDPRIRLVDVISGRADVEATSKLKRKLLGISPQSPYDVLRKPFAVALDSQGRILVTDSANGALIRFDSAGEKMDVFGTRGAVRLKTPLGLTMGPGDLTYVADVGIKKVVVFDTEGTVQAVYGHEGELKNPTDSLLSADGKRLFVADSKAHAIVVFSLETGDKLFSVGQKGNGEREFNFPTSLALGTEGEIFVVDQLNSRIQVLNQDGDYIDQFGSLGVGFGNLVRPKDIAVDDAGLIYVVDNAYNNVQIFDLDFTLLTFVGDAGVGPGRFHGASGVAVRGEQFAVVDQLGRRVQLFRFIAPRDGA